MVINGSTRSTFSGALNYEFNSRLKRISHLLGAALLVFAAGVAYPQIDSTTLPDGHSPAQQVISKNQLLTPEKARKAMDRAREQFFHGRYESAQREIQRALDICPYCAWAHTFQGALYLQGGNLPEAARSFQRAIDQDPALGAAYLGIGMVCNAQGRFKDALVPLDRAAPYIPSSWLLYFQSSWAHLGIGELSAGLKDLARAQGLTASDPQKLSADAYLHGVVQSQLKDYEGARHFLEEAVKREPNGTFATLAKKRLQRLAPLEERNDKSAALHPPLAQRPE